MESNDTRSESLDRMPRTVSLSTWIKGWMEYPSQDNLSSKLSHRGDIVLCEDFVLSRWVGIRSVEYLVGRRCARSALDVLGIDSGPLGRETSGAPCWPRGVIGSITHRHSYVAAAVSAAEEIVGLGIDIEEESCVRISRACSPFTLDEYRSSVMLRQHLPHLDTDALLFSAKESLFKALSPSFGRRIRLLDCEVFPFIDGRIVGRVLIGSRDMLEGMGVFGFWGRFKGCDSRSYVKTAFVIH